MLLPLSYPLSVAPIAVFRTSLLRNSIFLVLPNPIPMLRMSDLRSWMMVVVAGPSRVVLESCYTATVSGYQWRQRLGQFTSNCYSSDL